MNVKDSVAIITGGASGLGEACVRTLTAKGGKAVIFDLQEELGSKLAKEIGNNVLVAQVDVTNAESVAAGISKALGEYGKIDIVVNCAGTGAPTKVLSKKGPHPLEVFTKIITINLVGTFNVIRLAVEQMAKNTPGASGERGVIVNTSSVAAFDGQIGQAAYSASKAAICGMTLPIARECADYGIRVMTIAPGIFDTPLLGSNITAEVRVALNKMVPFPARMGQPAEFASMVREIVENSYLNGEVIRLDGAIRIAAR
ncbi:MAG: 3-hydroxyacyl-CoA dehydrogenase [Deltaproteobacteria bacterium HGW-Deltaproteobacteria-12]|jgi:NAD(P)-dependent dehydrogenase (short-subunit alcohol dehydrogenase family)|nr:MAG: 3-hydroxyacyl-CoA dehydrogenase [Deltaproteobacteria bacterium HGW-Deltaproteobacteria-12]